MSYAGDLHFTIAAIGFTLAAFPQIIKLLKEKKTQGISLMRNFIIFAMIAVTIRGCFIDNLKFSIITNLIQLGLVSIIIGQIIYYRKKVMHNE